MLVRLFTAVVFVLELSFVVSITCPTGYTDSGNDVCYKTYGNAVDIAAARSQCKADAAHLVEVQNAFINTIVLDQGKDMNVELWIGLTCNGTGRTNCYYEDGTKLTVNSYTNFYSDKPDSDVGNCVFMATFGNVAGMWFSADCNSMKTGFTCQFTKEDPSPCAFGKSELNGVCYFLHETLEAKTQAESDCEAECGLLTTIFSYEENQLVQSLGANTSQPFVRIGLMYNGTNYIWADGTLFDPTLYTNFGHVDPELGSCVAMALTNEIVPIGKWINTDCTIYSPSVCKRAGNARCVNNTAPPTLSPAKCTSTYFYDLNATIYSPGFPTLYESNKCEYVMSTKIGYVAKIQFPLFEVDPSSEIKLYNTFMDTTPFTTLSGIVDPNRTFYSTGHQMKMVFSSPVGAPDDKNYQWEAKFASENCELGWTYSQEFNSCYKLVHNLTFSDAQIACEDLGAHLVSIHSDAENTFLTNFVSTGHNVTFFDKEVYIGLIRSGDTWRWTDGSKFDYINWADGEPTSFNHDENCTQIYSDWIQGGFTGTKYKWNSTSCEYVMRVSICKKPVL